MAIFLWLFFDHSLVNSHFPELFNPLILEIFPPFKLSIDIPQLKFAEEVVIDSAFPLKWAEPSIFLLCSLNLFFIFPTLWVPIDSWKKQILVKFGCTGTTLDKENSWDFEHGFFAWGETDSIELKIFSILNDFVSDFVVMQALKFIRKFEKCLKLGWKRRLKTGSKYWPWSWKWELCTP